MSIGNSPECLRLAILVGVMLVGRLGVANLTTTKVASIMILGMVQSGKAGAMTVSIKYNLEDPETQTLNPKADPYTTPSSSILTLNYKTDPDILIIMLLITK